MSKLIIYTIVCGLSIAINAAENKSQSTTVVQQTQLGLTIKGNQELPNILYIVPWKKGPGNDISPIQGRIVDEVYGPVDYNVFKRQIKLYREHQEQKSTPEQ
ncbi:hypothetical protein [Pleionea litopenaei]|uniref:Uncharacterized protein n=1 Tax=Pleionea litopenaei TaxID=3070815 RepID=A0AA51X6S2_9GAMM|nr:hypothetical protein [Pleionea sp. HL-JVS1]WMS87428.1 hypothetical protein Q9312_00520 [Pleionea sp. HL-JVS1]